MDLLCSRLGVGEDDPFNKDILNNSSYDPNKAGSFWDALAPLVISNTYEDPMQEFVVKNANYILKETYAKALATWNGLEPIPVHFPMEFIAYMLETTIYVYNIPDQTIDTFYHTPPCDDIRNTAWDGVRVISHANLETKEPIVVAKIVGSDSVTYAKCDVRWINVASFYSR